MNTTAKPIPACRSCGEGLLPTRHAIPGLAKGAAQHLKSTIDPKFQPVMRGYLQNGERYYKITHIGAWGVGNAFCDKDCAYQWATDHVTRHPFSV